MKPDSENKNAEASQPNVPAEAPEVFPSKRARAKKIPALRKGQQWAETSEREFRFRNNSPGYRYFRAMAAKHFSGVEIYEARRKLLISTICNDPAGLPPYQQQLNEAVSENAKEFVEHLGKGLYEGRAPVFSKAEAALLLKWDDQWIFTFQEDKVILPGLKWWRDEAVRNLLSRLPENLEKDGGLTLKAYQGMRDKLDLAPEKRKLVKKLEFLRNKTGKLSNLRVTFTGLEIPEAETPDTRCVILSVTFQKMEDKETKVVP